MKYFAVALSLALASLACGQDPSAKPAFKLTGMKCFGDKAAKKIEINKGGFKLEGSIKIGSLGSGEGPGAELADFTFPENQRKQYFEFEFAPPVAGKEISVVVKAIKTTLGANLDVITVSGKTTDDGRLPAEWSLKRNWPVGFYKVFFTSGGKPAGSAGYLVKAVSDRATPIKAKGVTIFSVKDGKSSEKTSLTTADHELVFKCATTGADTKGAKVRMFLGFEDVQGKKQIVPQSEVEITDWPLEDTELLYSYNDPQGLQTGPLAFVVFVNDEMLIAHPFEVTK